MSDVAGVRIVGQDAGATTVLERARQGFAKVGAAAKQAGADAAGANRTATAEEKRYEAEVQRVIAALKRKEMQTRASADAMRRLGMEQGRAALSGGGGAVMRADARSGVRGALMTGGRAMSGGSSGVGAGMSAAGGLVAFGPVLGGIGIAALAATAALHAFTSSAERSGRIAGEELQLRQQFNDALRQAREEWGKAFTQGWQSGGPALHENATRGIRPTDVAGTMGMGLVGAQEAAGIQNMLSGLSESVKQTIMEAVRIASVNGRDPMAVAASANETARAQGLTGGFLGTMTPGDLAFAGGPKSYEFSPGRLAGTEATPYGRMSAAALSAQLQQGIAQMQVAGNPQAAAQAASDAQRHGADITNPNGTVLREHNEKLGRQIELLQEIATAQGATLNLWQEIKYHFGGDETPGRKAVRTSGQVR
jgi:hypothetical protein